MNKREIIKARLTDKDCYHCKWCRAYKDNLIVQSELPLGEWQSHLLEMRKQTFNGRKYICVGAGRDTFSLDENLICDKYKKRFNVAIW